MHTRRRRLRRRRHLRARRHRRRARDRRAEAVHQQGAVEGGVDGRHAADPGGVGGVGVAVEVALRQQVLQHADRLAAK
jgi:hypothetical protein